MNISIYFAPECNFFNFSDRNSPIFQKILGLSDVVYHSDSTESLLFKQCALFCEGKIPLANLYRQAEGLTTGGNVMLALPVHLQLQRDTFVLTHPSALNLQSQELESIMQSFNHHFNEDGITFELSPQRHCYIHFAESIEAVTSSPYLATNQKIDDYLPSGKHASLLARVINEAQMLLFEHPVNAAREASGLLTVNGFWVYGEGDLGNFQSKMNFKLYGEHCMMQGLRHAANMPNSHALNFEEILKSKQDAVAMPNQHDDIEEALLGPALTALRSFKLQSLDLYLIANGKSVQLHLDAISSLRFWRKPKSLESLISNG